MMSKHSNFEYKRLDNSTRLQYISWILNLQNDYLDSSKHLYVEYSTWVFVYKFMSSKIYE